MLGITLFGTLMGLNIVQLPIIDRIRVRISRYHPEVMKMLSADTWPNRPRPMVAALSDFVWKGKYKPLSDPAITNLCRVVKVLTVALLVGMVPVLALIWQHR